jgi:hypothetical protein
LRRSGLEDRHSTVVGLAEREVALNSSLIRRTTDRTASTGPGQELKPQAQRKPEKQEQRSLEQPVSESLAAWEEPVFRV